MNDDPHICVICGDSIKTEKDSIVVEVLPSDDGIIQRLVHKECIENIKNSFLHNS